MVMAKVMLDVPQILQCPELPNGCEITSLCEVLNYLGFEADKCDLADNYLPRSEKWFGADPDVEYMGNPHLDDDSEESGYYCFPGAVYTAAERYLDTQNALDRYVPRDITGASEEELVQYLNAGIPVVFWASLHFENIAPDPFRSYDMLGGRRHHMYHHLHCMVLKGYDENAFYIADPLDYNPEVNRDIFMKIFEQMENRALVIIPTMF